MRVRGHGRGKGVGMDICMALAQAQVVRTEREAADQQKEALKVRIDRRTGCECVRVHTCAFVCEDAWDGAWLSFRASCAQ